MKWIYEQGLDWKCESSTSRVCVFFSNLDLDLEFEIIIWIGDWDLDLSMSPCIPQSVGGNVESNVGARKFSAVLSEIIRVNDTEYMVI